MKENTKSIHQFQARLNDGQEIKLADYKGKVLLVVNIASACGFTPQLKDLQTLRDSFGHDEFEILGFPSNDFGEQEPLHGHAITHFCEFTYGVKFPVFEMSKVVGQEANQIYKFLSDRKMNGCINSKPRWNFHKYLINKDGEVVDYFYSFTNPLAGRLKKKIKCLL